MLDVTVSLVQQEYMLITHKVQLIMTLAQLLLNSLSILSVENIRGAASTRIELTVVPASNDVVPVRDQILEIDTANSSITVTADTFVGGSADRRSRLYNNK